MINLKAQAQSFDTRQSMKKQTFEIFHYRDPKIDGVAMHHHDFYEIYFFLNGSVEYRVEGRTFLLEPGDLLLISPNEFHQPLVNPGAAYERIVLWIDKAYLESFCDKDVDLSGCFKSGLPSHKNLLRLNAVQRTDITEKLSLLIKEYYSDAFASNLSATGIFMQLMAEINRIALVSSSSGEPLKETPLISQVLQYISEHCSEDLSLENLAQHFYVSKYHLSHEFSRAVGTSVYRYIMLKRLLLAKQLLSDGCSPGDVCHRSGFQDYANFYRAFKAEYGVSPKEYTKAL